MWGPLNGMSKVSTSGSIALAHVSRHYLPLAGGQEIYIDQLNRVLVGEGYDVSVLQPRVAGKYLSQAERLRRPFVKFVPRLPFLPRFIQNIDWFWFNLMIRTRKRWLESQDILIVHYPFHYGPVRWHANSVILSHGVDWPPKPKTAFDRKKYESALQVRRDEAVIVANDTEFIRELGIHATPGEGCFKKLETNVWFIPNCIDTDTFFPRERNRQKIILVPRNVRKSRGIHLAIEAFHQFNKVNQGFRLRILGSYVPGKYYEHCRRLVRTHSLEDRIDFIGGLPNSKMIDAYNEAMITLIPTVAYEGTSISALESMACQTPVVSTRVGGLQDLPTVKADASPTSIFEKMSHVLTHWEEISGMQYSDTTRIFNLKNWGDAWLDVLREMQN